MTLPPELADYIIKYGCFAIFSLVFAQELGVPNPVPNEIVLLFAGYLTSIGLLSFPLIFLAGVFADFIGTSILYTVFYFFGEELLRHAPRWLPVDKVMSLEKKLSKGGLWSVFVGRLIPYLRGYTSVAAGLFRIPPKKFLSAVLLSAITWSGGYVIAGRILGKEWNKLASKLNIGEAIVVGLAIIFLIFFVIPAAVRYFRRENNKT